MPRSVGDFNFDFEATRIKVAAFDGRFTVDAGRFFPGKAPFFDVGRFFEPPFAPGFFFGFIGLWDVAMA